MRRRLFNLAALASLLTFLLTAVLWVRSHFVHDQLWWRSAENVGPRHYKWYLEVNSGRGGLGLSFNAEIYDRRSVTDAEVASARGRWRLWFRHWQRGEPGYPATGFGGRLNGRWGFHFRWGDDPATVLREVVVPYWALALSAAVVPALWLIRRHYARRRARWRRLGLCGRCGYDLRVGHVRCPECGEPVGPASQQEAQCPTA